MNKIEITEEQLNTVNSATKKVDVLTAVMAAAADAKDTAAFNKLYRRREDAIFDIRIVLLEQGLPVPPVKCSVILPF